MEQTSSAAYPNILVVDYVKKARVASPQILAKAEQFLQVGYQKLLTFERPGGGFDWWGNGPPLVWLSAYALQEFTDMARVYPIDRGIIDRTQRWLLQQQAADGSWSNIGGTHGESIQSMGDPKMVLTSYVVWSLLESDIRTPAIEKGVAYIRSHLDDAKDNAYMLALAANALAAWDPKDDSTHDALKRLEALRTENREWQASSYPPAGPSLTFAVGNSATVETTALAVLAMLKAQTDTGRINEALTYILKSKSPNGTWGSTSATILSLKALVAALGNTGKGKAGSFTILVNGKEAAKGEVTEFNADVMQVFDLKQHTKVGRNDVSIRTEGGMEMMYQVVGRYYLPWTQIEEKKPIMEVDVAYDRTELTTADRLKATATVRYHGTARTYMVIVDIGIPPGFSVAEEELAQMVKQRRIEKYTITARQVTLYLGDVQPGDVLAFTYYLQPKFPLKAKTPETVAYEYYTPAHRAAAKPVELTVREAKGGK